MVDKVTATNNVSICIIPDGPDSLYRRTLAAVIALLESKGEKVDPQQILLKGNEYVVWPDASLGCPEPGSHYAQVQVPGYKWHYQYRDKIYSVHTNYEGSQLIVKDPDELVCAPVELKRPPSIYDLQAGQS